MNYFVRKTRTRLGMTQAAFARLVGVSPNTVARWERGEMQMRPTTRRLIELLAQQHTAPKTQ